MEIKRWGFVAFSIIDWNINLKNFQRNVVFNNLSYGSYCTSEDRSITIIDAIDNYFEELLKRIGINDFINTFNNKTVSEMKEIFTKYCIFHESKVTAIYYFGDRKCIIMYADEEFSILNGEVK